jgi:hypothetical protein
MPRQKPADTNSHEVLPHLTIARAPSPDEHLGLFWREKKHQDFSPAAANKT